MRIDVLTLFPEIYPGPLGTSIVGRAVRNGLLEIRAVDVRNFAGDRRGTVDDAPYGGGPGMLMKVEPLMAALDSPETAADEPGGAVRRVILLGPRGRKFSQQLARELARERHLVLVCGHYEGIDERVRELTRCEEISIGDYVLTSGNLAAMVVADAVARLLPGALGCDESSEDESFSNGLLEYPQYTRPPEFRGLEVPEVLHSGDHGAVALWRRHMAEALTLKLRPDLWRSAVFGRLAAVKNWKKSVKKWQIKQEALKNGNLEKGQSGIPQE